MLACKGIFEKPSMLLPCGARGGVCREGLRSKTEVQLHVGVWRYASNSRTRLVNVQLQNNVIPCLLYHDFKRFVQSNIKLLPLARRLCSIKRYVLFSVHTLLYHDNESNIKRRWCVWYMRYRTCMDATASIQNFLTVWIWLPVTLCIFSETLWIAETTELRFYRIL